MIGGIGGWLLEHLGEHLGKEGLVWLLKQHLVLMGIDFQIWVWMALALAIIVVVVLIAWWLVAVLIAWWNREPDEAKDLPKRESRQDVWASVFWLLAILALLSFLVGWRDSHNTRFGVSAGVGAADACYRRLMMSMNVQN